eukprot:TRINITY_DN40570_c0_g1_i1.p1 TRINITY_DN40570_c0_g1~~TRINITY_DN40570_c0_g1_i1.p1  ORF type:complete len:1391 (+),score=398.29 TRINITY_DN40570_c0_g1_i1:106-4278(+)
MQFLAAGNNAQGQCGVDPRVAGAVVHRAAASPSFTSGDAADPIAEISCGEHGVVARTRRGRLLCTGKDINGGPCLSLLPLPEGVQCAVSVSCGGSFAVARMADGAVVSWGQGDMGQLGRDGFEALPGVVEGIPAAALVEAGGWFALAVAASGEVWGWGANGDGQLCTGECSYTEGRPTRSAVLSARGLRALRLGGRHGVAVAADGCLIAWGCGLCGQRGDGGCEPQAPQPVTVLLPPDAAPVVSIGTGAVHSAAVGADGSLWLWGDPDGGKLGLAAGEPVSAPTQSALPGGELAEGVTLGQDHTLVTTRSGAIYGCGASAAGLSLGPSAPQYVGSWVQCGVPHGCVPHSCCYAEYTVYSFCTHTAAEEAAAGGALSVVCAIGELWELAERYEATRPAINACVAQMRRLGCEAMLMLGQSAQVDTAEVEEAAPPAPLQAQPDGDEHSAEAKLADGLEASRRASVGGDALRSRLALFADRARADTAAVLKAADSARTPTRDGMLVCAAPGSRVLRRLRISPLPELPLGAIGAAGRSPAPPGKSAVLVVPAGDETDELVRCELPEAALAPAPPPSAVLRWLRSFPAAWAEHYGARDFHEEDVACGALRHRPRGDGRIKRCCLQRALRRVSHRVAGKVEDAAQDWAVLLPSIGGDTVREGAAAALVYSAELMRPRRPGRPPRRRDHQVYSTLSAAMRGAWDERVWEGGDGDSHSDRLRLFAPLVWHLCDFLRCVAAAAPHVTVYRGITALVAQRYEAGTRFVWPCLSSTAEDSKVAEHFAEGVGTLFVIREKSAAAISGFSIFPSEKERVLPPAAFRVVCRLPEALLCVLDTRSDVVLAEEEYDAESCRALPPEEAVALRLDGIRNAAFIFNDFAGRFVEPRVDADGSECTFFDYFFPSQGDGGCAAAGRGAVLLRGDGGTGKTSLLLGLMHEALSRAKKSAEHPTPVFIHLPWARGLLGPPAAAAAAAAVNGGQGPLIAALCNVLALDSGEAELGALRRRRLTLLLDSLDECECADDAGDLLRAEPLLPRGGFVSADWPLTQVVACCRREWLDGHGVGPQALDAGPVRLCDVLPFNTDEQATYLARVGAQEAALLCRRLKAKGDQVVPEAVARVRCVPPDAAMVEAIREAALGGKPTAEKLSELERAAGGVMQQATAGTLAALRASSPQLLGSPFVLCMAVSAAGRLRESAPAELQAAPRWVCYSCWLQHSAAERAPRAPELLRAFPEESERYARILSSGMRLAVAMFAAGRWQSTVGDCVATLGGDEAARGLLCVLPLRLDSAQRNSSRVSWRHRSLQEFLVGRALVSPDEVPAAQWHSALCGPLDRAPEVTRFAGEGLRAAAAADADSLSALRFALGCCLPCLGVDMLRAQLAQAEVESRSRAVSTASSLP